MKYQTFKYKNYGDCHFEVGNYLYNKQCMSISIVSEDGEPITVCTVNMTDYMYFPNTTTIKNYSENSGISKFLKKLGIIQEIYSSVKCNAYAPKGDTIDFCEININKLKEYSNKFNYEYSF